VVNAILDIALDFGILAVYYPTAGQMANPAAGMGTQALPEINNAIVQRYIAKKTNLGPTEYWKIEIHQNSSRIVPLELQTAGRE
jgi:hypothetical protein